MEVRNATDHRSTSDKVIAAIERPLHHRRIRGITLDQRIRRIIVVALGNPSVFGVVVNSDDLMAATQQLLDDIPTNEAGRAGDQDSTHVIYSPWSFGPYA